MDCNRFGPSMLGGTALPPCCHDGSCASSPLCNEHGHSAMIGGADSYSSSSSYTGDLPPCCIDGSCADSPICSEDDDFMLPPCCRDGTCLDSPICPNRGPKNNAKKARRPDREL